MRVALAEPTIFLAERLRTLPFDGRKAAVVEWLGLQILNLPHPDTPDVPILDDCIAAAQPFASESLSLFAHALLGPASRLASLALITETDCLDLLARPLVEHVRDGLSHVTLERTDIDLAAENLWLLVLFHRALGYQECVTDAALVTPLRLEPLPATITSILEHV